ncbi:MAG TPA: DHA2 family efflux MFS transporter permease subunit [Candidatus Binataceae bacterium]|jgi:MFS transporter, DHA2 family, multidrug resistance protein|nr:DHA2 family efflux MFS transporter permease subunit [Candidatus Binataceae bacterium]
MAEAAATIETPAQAHVYVEGALKWLIALAVILCTILEVLDSSIVNVALPHMQGSFSASVDEVTWVVTTYLVAAGIMIPTTGWIAGQFGRKNYFLVCIVTFVVSSAMCGAAQTLNQMVAFRFLQGIAGAALQPLSQAILMETFPPNEQALAMAMWGVGLMVAPIMGPTVGGWITDNWNWRWNFYINVPIGIAAGLMVYTFVHDPPYLRKLKGMGRADYLGIVCLVLSLGLGEIVMDRGDRADWFQSAWVCYFSAIALSAFVLLIVHEWRTPNPILQVKLITNRSFAVPTMLLIILTFTAYGMQILNPVFLQELLGYTAWKAGIAMAPRGVGVMAAMFFLGAIARRGFDTRKLVFLGYILIAVAQWELSTLDLSMSISNFVWPTLVQGVGMGLIFPTLAGAALSSVSRENMGYAASFFSMVRNIGASIGTSTLTTYLTHLEQTRQSYLVNHLTVFDAWRLGENGSHMPGSTRFDYMHQLVTGQKQGLAMIYGQVQRQAMMLSLNDIYRDLCYLMAVALIITCFLPRTRAQSGAASAAH